MKGEMPFAVTPKKSNAQDHDSRYDSAARPHQHSDLELPSDLQYRLERVFEEASIREEKYVKTIQEQESRLQTQAQQYLEALRAMRKEFTTFLAVRGGKAEPRWKQAAEQKRQARRQQAIRLNPIEFTLQTRLDYEKGNRGESSMGKQQPTLECHIICYYYTPLVQDYLRDHVPERLQLTLRSLFPNEQAAHQIRIVKEEDELDNVSCLLHRVPFQIATADGQAIKFQFAIPCSQEALSHYRRREFELELVDCDGDLPYGSASLSLSSLLYYDHQATEWQLRPLPFHCPLSGRQVGEMSIKLGNNLVLTDRSEHYRVESTLPMKVTQPVLYNDDESRLIQRISKFKTAHNSVLMGIGSQNAGNAERLFQSENEKIVLLHRQKKELESIQQYKNSHKQELMGKICSEALDRFCLADCHIGLPRYVVHLHTNPSRQHKKVYLKTELILKNAEDRPPTAGQIALKQALHVSILTPKQVSKLLQEELLKLPSQAHCDYEMDEQQQSMWTVSGMPHPLVLRIICFPPALSLLTSSNLQAHYELALTLTDDYNQLVDSYHTKLRLKLPPLERHLHLHGYANTYSHITLAFPPNCSKEVVSNVPALVCSWDASWTTLKLKIEHRSLAEKEYYLVVNDADHILQLGSYRLTLSTYPPLLPALSLAPGEIRKLTLPFTLDEATLTALLQPTTQTTRKQDQLRVLFASSRPQHCLVRCQGEPELLCKANKLYEVEVRLQTFDLSNDPERILIHAMDLTSRKILKKWLLEIEKEKADFKQILKLICEMNKPTRYKFELTNPDPQEKTYRLSSSNLGILKVPVSGITLIGNQRTVVELEFEVRQELSSEEQLQALPVLLTVTDGAAFSNYLFELTVRSR